MRNERGAALVLAMFVMVLLTSMGMALLFLGQQSTRMGRASLLEKRAFYLAEAGIEDARLTLYVADADRDFDDDLLLAAGPDGEIDFDPDALQAVYDGAGNLTGFTGFGDDVPLRPLAALAGADGRGWYMAFLTN